VAGAQKQAAWVQCDQNLVAGAQKQAVWVQCDPKPRGWCAVTQAQSC
jgi:hypothetical protein